MWFIRRGSTASLPPSGVMAETVTVTSQTGYDSNANPIPPGGSVTLPALGIAPGNTTQSFVQGGEAEDAEFTVYLELGSPINDDDEINVRGVPCRARTKKWISPWTGRGGIEVLCKSATGSGG